MKRGVSFLFLVLFPVIILGGCDEVVPGNYSEIALKEVKRWVESGESIILLDVRSPSEYEQMHIKNSVLLPIEPEDLVTEGIATVSPDKSTPIVVFCRTGRRSRIAVEVLVNLGYENVYNLGAYPHGLEE